MGGKKMTDILHQAAAIAEAAQSPLDRLEQLYGIDTESDAPRWRIWTNAGLRHCRHCGRADRWTDEGASYVCEHEPPEWGCWAIRQLDSVGRGWVVDAEVAE
jgi:hypothetical protein